MSSVTFLHINNKMKIDSNRKVNKNCSSPFSTPKSSIAAEDHNVELYNRARVIAKKLIFSGGAKGMEFISNIALRLINKKSVKPDELARWYKFVTKNKETVGL